jgi:ATP-dependent exoDNAse (exonuclease V) alpha subunit
MLRCDLLDCIEKFLRINRAVKRPFGGVQMVFIGDLKQLPPVVKSDEKEFFSTVYSTPYFLGANCLLNNPPKTIELKKIYRQHDEHFISLLNAIRDGSVGPEGIKKLNERVSKDVEVKDMAVYLATTNRKAASINEHYLKQIKVPPYEFCAEKENMDESSKSFPADDILIVKKGAQVMMLNNDSKGRWVNGSMGTVEDIKLSVEADKVLIYVKFPNGRIEPVEPYKWELFKYKWNEKRKQIETESAGSFKQYPLKLSWAVTIHKSQGKTFENVIVDMERGAFAAGQLYVALSRCKTFEGIRLARPISERDL